MKIRIKFSKHGAVKFIGHLDMMRFFQKAIRRAEIDIAYSGGYSPHQIMSFAAPLSVGHTSDGEYFDIEVNSFTSGEDIKHKLNQVLVEGIEVLEVSPLKETEKNAMASVAAADYIVTFRDLTILPLDWKEKLLSFYQQKTIPIIKKTKKSERELDLKDGIYALELREDAVYLLLNASSSGSIKPTFVIESFFDSLGITLPAFFMMVKRLDTYQEVGGEGNQNLVPLISEWEN